MIDAHFPGNLATQGTCLQIMEFQAIREQKLR